MKKKKKKKKIANNECRNLFGAKYDLTDTFISLFRINLAQKEPEENGHTAFSVVFIKARAWEEYLMYNIPAESTQLMTLSPYGCFFACLHLLTYIYTYILAYIHTVYTYTYICTYINICEQTYIYKYMHTQLYA